MDDVRRPASQRLRILLAGAASAGNRHGRSSGVGALRLCQFTTSTHPTPVDVECAGSVGEHVVCDGADERFAGEDDRFVRRFECCPPTFPLFRCVGGGSGDVGLAPTVGWFTDAKGVATPPWFTVRPHILA